MLKIRPSALSDMLPQHDNCLPTLEGRGTVFFESILPRPKQYHQKVFWWFSALTFHPFLPILIPFHCFTFVYIALLSSPFISFHFISFHFVLSLSKITLCTHPLGNACGKRRRRSMCVCRQYAVRLENIKVNRLVCCTQRT